MRWWAGGHFKAALFGSAPAGGDANFPAHFIRGLHMNEQGCMSMTASPLARSAPAGEASVPWGTPFFGTADTAVFSTPALPVVGTLHFHAVRPARRRARQASFP
jgi:hypothetical protein